MQGLTRHEDEVRKPPCGELSGLLRAWGDGDQKALERLTPIVYDEPRSLAHASGLPLLPIFHGRIGHCLAGLVKPRCRPLVEIDQNAIATLLDRLTHHADVTLIEGTSYRVRESEQEATARRKPRPKSRKGSPDGD